MSRIIVGRELENILEPFRYYDRKKDILKLSGFPNDWTYNSVYENKPNPNYYDNNFTYYFPITYERNAEWMRPKIEEWISINENRNIKYIRRLNNYDYEMYNVRVGPESVDWDAKTIRFRVVY